MTARKAPTPDGLNAVGNGRGLKKVTRPITKKRGANATEGAKVERIAQNREQHVSLTNLTTAELAELDPDRPLTDKAKLFVRFWAQGESVATASAKAGYGDGASYAYRLVHTPAAKALYAEEKRLFEEANQMSRRQVMDGLLEGIEMAKLLAEPATVISGWREIGKLCGYYEPVKTKVEVSVTGQLAFQKLDQMSTEDLIKLIEQRTTSATLLGEPDDDNDQPD